MHTAAIITSTGNRLVLQLWTRYRSGRRRLFLAVLNPGPLHGGKVAIGGGRDLWSYSCVTEHSVRSKTPSLTDNGRPDNAARLPGLHHNTECSRLRTRADLSGPATELRAHRVEAAQTTFSLPVWCVSAIYAPFSPSTAASIATPPLKLPRLINRPPWLRRPCRTWRRWMKPRGRSFQTR